MEVSEEKLREWAAAFDMIGLTVRATEVRELIKPMKTWKCGICGEPYPADAFCAPCVLD